MQLSFKFKPQSIFYTCIEFYLSSNTFSTVSEKTNLIWKTQRYELVREFDSRPLFPPPLVLISHVYHAYLHFYRKIVVEDKTKFGFREFVYY